MKKFIPILLIIISGSFWACDERTKDETINSTAENKKLLFQHTDAPNYSNNSIERVDSLNKAPIDTTKTPPKDKDAWRAIKQL